MTMNDEKIIELEHGWEFIQKGITKLKKILEGYPEPHFSSEDYMILYTTVFSMCTQKPPHDYSQQMYDRYKEAFDEYITSTVLPSLREKHDEYMLRELVKRWSNHKVMVTWLSRFFHYLDRYFIARETLPPLNEVGLACFRDQVYMEINGKVRDAVISLIDQEREGELIDQALLKNVLDIFVEIGMGSMEYYENDFETAVLKDTAAYYSRNASIWIREDSCPDCMLKAAEECLRLEKDRVSHYLHSSSEQRLLEKVQHELLFVYASQLLEKEHSGCRALPRDDKVEDLSRMYRLFSKINKGLDPVSQIFKQHVTAEGTTLVKQAEDAASNKKDFHVDALEKFVEEAGVPVITTFNNDRNNHPFVIKFFNSPNAKAMLFLNFSSENFEAFKSKYHHTAEHYKGSGISFLIGDIDASQGAFQFFGLKEDQVPLIIIQTEDGQKYLKANLEPDHIAPWLKEYTDGSLKPFKKSEPIPEVNNEPVKVVVADTLHEMLNSGKNVLLEFYAPWCGHCKKPAPILDEVAVSVGSDPDVVIAKIDATANDIPGDTFDVKGYPTIYFSSPNGSIMQYEGDRSKEDIIEFIQKNKHTVAQPDPVKDEL